MGVYIKGMEMPEKTYAHCMLIKDIDGSVQLYVYTKNSEEISEWEVYDLVPVPPHRRLVDADALKDAFCGNCFADENPMECSEPCMDMKIILDAPTIIPASEEEA